METEANAKQRHFWLRLVQVVIAAGLMMLLLRQVAWSSLPPLLANLHWRLVALGIGLLGISHLINVARWQYLLQHHATSYRTLLAFYGAGLFSNNFLPTGVGGDGIRMGLLSRRVSLNRAMFSVGLDRIVGLVALSTLLGLGLWNGLPSGLELGANRAVITFGQWKLLLSVLFLTAGLGLLSLVTRHGLLDQYQAVSGTFARLTANVDLSEWTIGRAFRLLTGGYILSVLSHLCIVAGNWLMLQAMGIEITPGAAIWLVLAVTASLLLPSINGLGVREAAYIVILTSYGVANAPALLAASLSRLTLVLFGLAGGAGWLLSTRSAETMNHIPIV